MFLNLRIVKEQGISKKKPIIIISKKVIKSAVKRNLIKRRIRVILKNYLPPPAYCFLVIVNAPEIVNLTFKELQAEIKKQLEKININD